MSKLTISTSPCFAATWSAVILIVCSGIDFGMAGQKQPRCFKLAVVDCNPESSPAARGFRLEVHRLHQQQFQHGEMAPGGSQVEGSGPRRVFFVEPGIVLNEQIDNVLFPQWAATMRAFLPEQM